MIGKKTLIRKSIFIHRVKAYHLFPRNQQKPQRQLMVIHRNIFQIYKQIDRYPLLINILQKHMLTPIGKLNIKDRRSISILDKAGVQKRFQKLFYFQKMYLYFIQDYRKFIENHSFMAHFLLIPLCYIITFLI